MKFWYLLVMLCVGVALLGWGLIGDLPFTWIVFLGKLLVIVGNVTMGGLIVWKNIAS